MNDAPAVGTRNATAQTFGTPRVIMWTAAVTVLALVAALAVQVLRTHRVQSRLDDTTRALAASRLHVEVGAALIEAQQGNYELARQRASTFFSRLQDEALAAGGNAMTHFDDLLARRDSTITTLSRGGPASVALLRSLNTDYETLQRTYASAPSPDAP